MNESESNIFITGYMGSGKTTVGRILAQRLEKRFLDMDEEIEKNQDMSINRIFMKYGEHQFRNLEAEMLDRITGNGSANIVSDNMVVSCGGGIILDDKNREILKDEYVIWLDSDPETMFERIKNNPNLPNAYFHMEDSEERLKVFSGQYEQRRKLYEEISDITVDTGTKNIDGIVAEICEKIR